MKKQDKTAYVAPITEILCVKSEHVMNLAGSEGGDFPPGGGEGGDFGDSGDSKKGFFDDEDFIWDSHHDNQWEDDVLSLQRENE